MPHIGRSRSLEQTGINKITFHKRSNQEKLQIDKIISISNHVFWFGAEESYPDWWKKDKDFRTISNISNEITLIINLWEITNWQDNSHQTSWNLT